MYFVFNQKKLVLNEKLSRNLSWGAFYSHLYCSCLHPRGRFTLSQPHRIKLELRPQPSQDDAHPTHRWQRTNPRSLWSWEGQRRLGGHETFPLSTFLEDLIFIRVESLCSSPLVRRSYPSLGLRARLPTGQAHKPSEVVRVWPGFRLRSILTDLIHYKTLLFLFEEEDWVREGDFLQDGFWFRRVFYWSWYSLDLGIADWARC